MAVLDRLFARFYDRVLEPSEVRGLADMRHELLTPLSGTVVEIGAGTGLNLPHYPAEVERVVACEPHREMADRLRARAAREPRAEVIEAPGEALPLPDGGADHAVATLVLCTVDDLDRTATELARVVRPGGTLALIEHIGDTGGAKGTAQQVIEPVWKVAARGCHLTRNPTASLEAAGFDTSELREWRIPGSVGLIERALVGHAVRR